MMFCQISNLFFVLIDKFQMVNMVINYLWYIVFCKKKNKQIISGYIMYYMYGCSTLSS
jgi:hypothetical protein